MNVWERIVICFNTSVGENFWTFVCNEKGSSVLKLGKETRLMHAGIVW